MSPWTVVGIEVALAVVVGLVAAGARWRRTLGLAIALIAAALPYTIEPGHPTLAFLAGLVGALTVFRAIDLARDRSHVPVGRRVWLMLATFDVRRATRRPPGFSARAFAACLLAAAIALAALYVAVPVADHVTGPAHWALRWTFGLVFAVASADTATRLLPIPYALAGITPPPLHDAPHLSRTVGELWFQRWNKSVGTWLRLNCFQPVARRGHALAGLIAAFVASTLLHIYLTHIALGLTWALVMGAFFALQIAFVLAERALRVGTWQPAAGHIWTLGVMALASPLFVEPFLRLLDL